METSIKMQKSIEQLLHDIRVADERLRSIQTEIGYLDFGRRGDIRILRVKELVADLHARLQGMQDFVIACKDSVENQGRQEPEELDLWM